jgi:pantoate--beta-alanine ligase
MVRDLNLPVEVVPMPTLREPDGLAMSSRNAYLTPSEREAALCLHRALTLAQEMWTRGLRDAETYRTRLRELMNGEEAAGIDYVSVADPENLVELGRIQGPALVSLAVRIGRTRLIDNVTLGTRPRCHLSKRLRRRRHDVSLDGCTLTGRLFSRQL